MAREHGDQRPGSGSARGAPRFRPPRAGRGTDTPWRRSARARSQSGSRGTDRARFSEREAVGRDGERQPPRHRTIAEEIRTVARPGQGERAVRAFEEAVSLMERGRDAAAVNPALEAKSLAPRSGAVREVLGLALYRAERFREALRELQAYRRMTGRADQDHLIADCYRAIGAPEKAVQAARSALRARVPDEVRAEAAIVAGSALADLGRFTEALSVLRSFRSRDRQARPYDLRVWYVTGDVLERAGRPEEAREEFVRVVRHDPDIFDVAERLARLS